MMSDINIWSSALPPHLVSKWMSCELDDRLQENRIVDWLTANWTVARVDVKTIQKSNICWHTEEEKIYSFPTVEKDFLDSADFCNILKGTIPVPKTEFMMSHMFHLHSAACGGSPYTGEII